MERSEGPAGIAQAHEVAQRFGARELEGLSVENARHLGVGRRRSRKYASHLGAAAVAFDESRYGVEIEDLAMDDPSPEDQTVKKNANRLLYQALGLLDEEKREVLILSRFQYMKYEEIAEVMQCTVGTVKSRVFWALKDLGQIYKKLSGEQDEM